MPRGVAQHLGAATHGQTLRAATMRQKPLFGHRGPPMPWAIPARPAPPRHREQQAGQQVAGGLASDHRDTAAGARPWWQGPWRSTRDAAPGLRQEGGHQIGATSGWDSAASSASAAMRSRACSKGEPSR